MKKTLKLNIGNYQNINHETQEHDDPKMCYEEFYVFLKDWEGVADHANILLRKMKPIWDKYGINDGSMNEKGGEKSEEK